MECVLECIGAGGLLAALPALPVSTATAVAVVLATALLYYMR